MKKNFLLFSLFFTFLSYCQTENHYGIFENIANEMQNFKIDTTAVPNDNLTTKIKELRNLKGGFNINEALEYKIAEERTKKDVNKEELDKMERFFKLGNGKKWLDNAVIRIYRNLFTYQEIKHLIKFYKSSAGQKMATKFPIIMIQSLKSAEEITEMYKQQIKN